MTRRKLKERLDVLAQRANEEQHREYLLGYGPEIWDVLKEMQTVYEQKGNLDVGYLRALSQGLGYILISYESIMMSKLADDIADFLNDQDAMLGEYPPNSG